MKRSVEGPAAGLRRAATHTLTNQNFLQPAAGPPSVASVRRLHQPLSRRRSRSLHRCRRPPRCQLLTAMSVLRAMRSHGVVTLRTITPLKWHRHPSTFASADCKPPGAGRPWLRPTGSGSCVRRDPSPRAGSAAACPAAALLRAPSATQPPQDGRLPIYKLGKLQPDDKEILRFGMVREGLGTAPQPDHSGEPIFLCRMLAARTTKSSLRSCMSWQGGLRRWISVPASADRPAGTTPRNIGS